VSSLEKLLRALPKAELHIHLEGSIRPEMAYRLGKRRGIELPGIENGVEGLREVFRFTSFLDFIRLYVTLSSTLVKAEDFADVVADVASGLAEQRVRYAEITFTPMTHVIRGVRPSTMFAGLAQGRQRALEVHGVEIAWVFDIVRNFPDQAHDTLEMALAQRGAGNGVVALGIGGVEGRAWSASSALREAFTRARSEQLHRVPHAGEQASAWSIREALDEYHAERIGHGFRCIEDPKILDRLARDQIPLELCPGSNVALGLVPSLDQHALPKIDAAGVPWSLATDDPPLLGTNLFDEYRSCAAQWNWSKDKVCEVAAAAVKHSFLAREAKDRLLDAQRAVAEGC